MEPHHYRGFFDRTHARIVPESGLCTFRYRPCVTSIRPAGGVVSGVGPGRRAKWRRYCAGIGKEFNYRMQMQIYFGDRRAADVAAALSAGAATHFAPRRSISLSLSLSQEGFSAPIKAAGTWGRRKKGNSGGLGYNRRVEGRRGGNNDDN